MSKLESPAWQKWSGIIHRQRASGRSAAVFCRENGLATSSFFAWKRKFVSIPRIPTFVEARVVGRPPGGRPTGMIEVRLHGGRRVRVGRAFDRDVLAEVVAVLEALPAKAEGSRGGRS